MGVKSSQPRSPNLNKTDGHLIEYFRNAFVGGGGGTNPPPPSGITATGGIISDYTTGPAIYRAHIFTSTGTFEITELGDFGDTVEYLVIAGGGGGGVEGSQRGGGGGAGGYRTNVPTPIGPGNHTTTNPFPVSATSYDVIIGAGAAGGNPGSGQGFDGGDSQFGPPSLAARIISKGGGGGGRGSVSNSQNEGRDGGSGGGGGSTASGSATEPGGATTPVTTPSPWPGPSTQGFAGGQGEHADGSWAAGGGGGGAGEAGKAGTNPNTNSSHGGDGLSNLIAGPENNGVGVANPESPGRWFAGGGAGIHFSPGTGNGGAGGGGSTSYPGRGGSGVSATGGGGASGSTGGNGGSGIVIVRYQIASIETRKATGGAISFYGGKTIHTFTSSGTFATTSDWSPTNVEYVVVGGGGAGCLSDVAGAGGAGGYITNTNHPIGTHPVTVNVQVGAGGAGQSHPDADSPGGDGTPSYFGTPLTAYGGGGGASPNGTLRDGGSGGGGAYNDPSGGTGSRQTGAAPQSAAPITPQGNPGGHGPTQPPAWGSGGGGGAGGAGGDGSPTAGGAGGVGIRLPSTFRDPRAASPPSPWPGTGDQITGGLGTPGPAGAFYVGGGGGGTADSTSSDPGGSGGYGGGGAGANGPQDVDAQSGVVNTGGGGGGADNGNSYTPSGGGGSGIVLIAYPT